MHADSAHVSSLGGMRIWVGERETEKKTKQKRQCWDTKVHVNQPSVRRTALNTCASHRRPIAVLCVRRSTDDIFRGYKCRCVGLDSILHVVFLNAFAEWRKASVKLHACPSDFQHEIPRLPLDVFFSNLIFDYFSKIYRQNSNFIKMWQE